MNSSINCQVDRTDENGTTQYLYGNPNHPFQLTAVRSPSGSLSHYHYDDFGLLFALERDNNWYYITTDQLGTPRVVCDANGEVVKVLEYDSFGQVIADSHPELKTWFLSHPTTSQKPGFCDNLCIIPEIWGRNPVSLTPVSFTSKNPTQPHQGTIT